MRIQKVVKRFDALSDFFCGANGAGADARNLTSGDVAGNLAGEGVGNFAGEGAGNFAGEDGSVFVEENKENFAEKDSEIVAGVVAGDAAGEEAGIVAGENLRELEKEQAASEQCLIKQQDPHGEIDTTVKPSQGDEEGTALRKDLTITASTHSELASSTKEQDVDVRDSLEAADKDTSMEQQFSKASHFSTTSQFPSMPSKGGPSKIVEDSSSSLPDTRELEQLVSKKYLDNENLSLLSDFLAKHPSVLLKDNSLSNRYKGYAYNCLAELLKFLQSHSVLDVSVSGASHIEFVELVQDVRRCPFDKEWLNDVEKRILFTGLQISQAALQKLLDSKHILNEHVKDLKHQLTSSEAVLESITQQEAQISQNQAALSHPIGY